MEVFAETLTLSILSKKRLPCENERKNTHTFKHFCALSKGARE